MWTQMTTSQTSWLSMGVRGALFDELVKIGQDHSKKKPEPHPVKEVAKGILAASIGAGLGNAAAESLVVAFPNTFLKPTPFKRSLVKITLPTVGAIGTMMAARKYRNAMDNLYRKMKDWKGSDGK